MKSLVIGGTLFIGRVLVAKLLARGHEVAVLHRKPEHDLGPEVEGLQGDRNDAATVAAAVAGREFDYVFDNVFDWSQGTTGAQVEATARVFAKSGLRRYVFISSVAAYRGDPGDQVRVETSPLADDGDPDLYKRYKAMSERALFGLYAREGFPAVTLRPPFVYGPGNPFYREAFFFQRFADNRPILVPEDGSRLMQFVHLEDLAEAEVLAAETDEATGQAFNVADPQPVSQRQMVEILAKATGRGTPPQIFAVAREQLLASGGRPMAPPFYFGAYLDVPPLPQDCTKLQKVLGFTPRGLLVGMSETWQWWQRTGHSRYPAPNYDLEERFYQ